MRLGVIDIGSNTVHLLVVDAHYGAAPIAAHSHKMELRLSEHLTESGAIDSAATQSLIDFTLRAQVIGEDLGVTDMEAFATSAIREASNGEDVLRQVRKATGIATTTVTGDDEARLTFLAVRRWFGWSAGRLLVLDIGGGSLEIAIGGDEEPDLAFSMPLGAGHLTRTMLSGDPPDEDSVRELRRHIRAEIAGSVGRIQRLGLAERAVATSKTFKQLARIAGAAPSSEGPFVRRTLSLTDLSAWLPKLAAMTTKERGGLPGVSVGRAPQLVAGALVAEAAMELLDVDEVDICPWALREGVILRRLDGLNQ
ncbi:MAG: Ppx/GppA phosphatase family protein [Candidatus Nanopelagicales bacterium]